LLVKRTDRTEPVVTIWKALSEPTTKATLGSESGGGGPQSVRNAHCEARQFPHRCSPRSRFNGGGSGWQPCWDV